MMLKPPKRLNAVYRDRADALVAKYITPALTGENVKLQQLLAHFDFADAPTLRDMVAGALELGVALQDDQTTEKDMEFLLETLEQPAVLELLIDLCEKGGDMREMLTRALPILREKFPAQAYRKYCMACIYLQKISQQCQIGPFDQDRQKGSLHVDEFLDSTYELIGRDDLIYPHYMLGMMRQGHSTLALYRKAIGDKQLFVTFEGKRWQVTGASRLGDIWLTPSTKLDAQYRRRVWLRLDDMTNWSDTP